MTSSNGNIFGPGEFPTQRPMTRSFDVFFNLRLNKRLSKQPWGWWFETPSWSLWRHCNEMWRVWCGFNEANPQFFSSLLIWEYENKRHGLQQQCRRVICVPMKRLIILWCLMYRYSTTTLITSKISQYLVGNFHIAASSAAHLRNPSSTIL